MLVATLAAGGEAPARVAELTLTERTIVAGGRDFGQTGPYERVRGVLHLALDPDHPRNAGIVDLENAPRNGDGAVAARADFMLLRPAHGCPAPCTVLLEVPNRGRKAALAYLARAPFTAVPAEAADFGDGLLMRRGLVLAWVGWQFDVPPGDDRLRIEVPVARAHAGPIVGPARSDWVVTAPRARLPLGHRGHRPYPPADPGDPRDVLTYRTGRLAPRTPVPRERWAFEAGGTVRLEGGFRRGRVYELVYTARDPVPVGVGLAAVRDFVAFLRHDPRAPVAARHALAFGVSQSGRFLRHFLHQGFNTDEAGRAVFDGMLIHAAGAGRGSFNHRFAQPSRDGHRYSAFFYPTDLFPFTSRTQRDPVSGRRDGLAAGRRAHWPRVFYTNTGYEYWGRAAALTHTSVDGARDVAPLARERMYHLAGTQHFVARPPDGRHEGGPRPYAGNPADFLPQLRALAMRLLDWVRDGEPPPPTRVPRIDAGTLVPLSEHDFPAIPGVAAPGVAHEAYRLDFGPRWGSGIVDRQPPAVGPAFPVRVPAVDRLGHARAGIRPIEVAVPVATWTPWRLYGAGAGAPAGELRDFQGMLVPLARTEADRRASGDPRPSLETLYPDRADYAAQVRAAVAAQVEAGLLLEEDAPRAVRRASAWWDWVQGDRAAPPGF